MGSDLLSSQHILLQMSPTQYSYFLEFKCTVLSQLQSYIRSGALRRLSYTSDTESAIAGGDTADELEVEMQLIARHRHEQPGDVSLIVRDAKPRCASVFRFLL